MFKQAVTTIISQWDSIEDAPTLHNLMGKALSHGPSSRSANKKKHIQCFSFAKGSLVRLLLRSTI